MPVDWSKNTSGSMQSIGNNTWYGGTINAAAITSNSGQSQSLNNFLQQNKYASPMNLGPMPTRETENARLNIKAEKQDGQYGGFSGEDMTKYAGIAGGIGTALTSMLGKQYDDAGFQDEQMAANVASQFGPWGMLASALASTSSQLTRSLDANTSKISDRAKDAAGVRGIGQFGNNMLSWINNTSFGLWGGGLMNKTNDYTMSDEARQLAGAYGGTAGDMMAAEDVAGSRFFFGQKKLNNLVNSSIKNDQLLAQIGIDNNQRISSVPYNADNIESRNFKKMYGMTGQNYGTYVGKHGFRLPSHEELNKIISARKESDGDVQKLENGGSILIPDGALHAHKHHMEDANPDLAEDLTKKGVPVVTVDDKGEVTQVAEIEKEEITMSSELTKKVEELWKKDDEESMIECGKLVVDALFNDSTDNAGLIDKVE